MMVEYFEFQFPSNGKTYPKQVERLIDPETNQWVSIPFKRENLSKATLDLIPA